MTYRQMTARETRSVIIFWTVILALILGAFAADGLLKSQTCVSSQISDASGTVFYPEQCYP